ncbi:hypothetical protein ACG0Z6_04190 [Roseateles sp. BYS180W]|uniref:Uncharacterized protein n=1 Tax=Roseateles rivi TaxID=3299028 RepID=A0ABW7FSX7_9BURK
MARRNRARTALLGVVLLAAYGGSWAHEPSATPTAPACERPALLARLQAAVEVPGPPSLSRTPGSWVARLALQDPNTTETPLQQQLIAVVDAALQQAWLLEYGGPLEGRAWRGPVPVALDTLQGCPEVQAAMRRAEYAAANTPAVAAAAASAATR